MSNQLKKIFILLLPLALIPYLLICFFNNPNADDFVYGFISQKQDLFSGWLEQYLTWSGRYTSNFFVLSGPLKWDSFTLYKFIPWILILLMWLSIDFLLRSLLNKVLEKREIQLSSILLVLLFMYNMPIISEGLYWYTGAVTYLLGCIFVTYYITLLYRFYHNQCVFKSKLLHVLILTPVLIFCMGFNEVLMFLLVGFNMTVFMIVQIFKLKHYRYTILLVMITILGSSLVLMAPGNAVRENQFSQSHQFWYSLGFSLAQTGRFFVMFVLSPPLWIMSFAWVFIHRKLVIKVPLFQKKFYLHRYISLLLLPLTIFICVFPAYWATGILGQHRTLNVAYWFFIFIWFLNLSVWFSHWGKRISSIQIPKQRTVVLLFVLTFGCFLFVKNGFYCSMDLITGRAKNFDFEMKNRYTLMNSTNDTIEFIPIKSVPKTISYYEVTDNPSSWLNVCWISYFGKEGEAVVVKK